jgi:RNA polymerase sigma-70 factor, ECF subfamily
VTSEFADAQAMTARSEARDGVDHAAFGKLVREHQAMVYSIARNTLQDREAAEEVAQDVFLRLYRDLHSIESPQHMVHWLRRVTANRCIDAIRRRRWLPVPIDESFPAVEREPEDSLAIRTIHRLMRQLPARQRVVLALRFQEDLEIPEIARTLEIPLNTVKSHLRRGVEAIRRGMERTGRNES